MRAADALAYWLGGPAELAADALALWEEGEGLTLALPLRPFGAAAPPRAAACCSRSGCGGWLGRFTRRNCPAKRGCSGFDWYGF